MTLLKWEPFQELMTMQDRMARLIGSTFSRIRREEALRGVWFPPVDILERKNELVLRIDLPEVSQKEIDIRVEENTIIIQGERKFIKEESEGNYLQVERPYGTFRRMFAIPRMIDQERIQASYKDGVLQLILPRREEAHPKQILVEPE